MMVDSKKYDSSVSWREAAETEIEVEAIPPAYEETQFLKEGDPVEALLETYDFAALHDRIMMAITTAPTEPTGRLETARRDQTKEQSLNSARKEKLS